MKRLIALVSLLVSTSAFATEPTVKSMAHSTYLCGENGLVIKTSGLAAKIGEEDDYKILSSDNKPDTDESPAYLTIQYAKSASSNTYANWFSLTLTKHSEFIALTFVNKARGIEIIGMSCQIIE